MVILEYVYDIGLDFMIFVTFVLSIGILLEKSNQSMKVATTFDTILNSLDATWLLKEAGVGNLVSYPYFKKATATDLIKKYYSGLSRETLMKLYDTYRLD